MNHGLTRSFGKIWYATPERIASAFKFVVFSDRGWLEASPDLMNFSGNKEHFDMGQITSVSLVRQKFAWGNSLITLVFIGVWLYTLQLRSYRGSSTTPIVAIAAFVFGTAVSLSTRWVRVEYTDEMGVQQVAFFADGSALGWGGILGGTRRLYDELSSMYGKS